jgi:predicted ATPase
LPDEVYADWTREPREALRRLHREASLKLAAFHSEARRYPDAIPLLMALVTREACDEHAQRELMRAFALAGRRHEALRQYQACVQALATELGVSPEPPTTALYQHILSGELAPPVAAPARELMSFETGPDASLVGRETEFEALRFWLREAWRGQGRTILLSGDTGVGKTRLALEALCAATGAGFAPLFGAAYEQEGQLAYQPFIEAFDRHLNAHQRPFGENPITHFKPLGSSDPQQEHWALFNAAAKFLRDLAAHSPVVLLLDDLHAADETTLRLFHFLARHLRDAPVMLLATYRSDVPASAPFSAMLAALYREQISQSLALSPLSAEACDRLLAQILGGAPEPTLAQVVFEATEGNPFFAQELARALVKAGQIETVEGKSRLRPEAEVRVPTDLAGLLRERVKRQPPPVESVLTAAATLGREFGFDVLRHMADLPEAVLLTALDTALEARLIEESANGYRFRHALIRLALYEAASRSRRTWLHTRAVEAIETVFAQRPSGLLPHAEALAFHCALSDQRERAVPYLMQAGQRAAGAYAFEVAIRHFERALSLMDELGLENPAWRWMILSALGWWSIILADTPRAVACFEQALALPPSPDWKPARRERSSLHRGAVMALITAGDADAAEAHLQAALAEVDEREDAAEYAHVLYNVAQFHWHRNAYREAFDLAQRSLAIAERLNDPVAIARAFEMLALACHSLGEWQNGMHYEQQRTALAGPSLDVTEAFDVHL